MELKIGIRDLAWFCCASGDLTSEFSATSAYEQGSIAHKEWQSKYNDLSKSEVYVKYSTTYLDASVLLTGFMDGLLVEDDKTIIEEIKSTKLALDKITLDYHKEHLAQLKIYGYIYLIENNLESVNLRLTYITPQTFETTSFNLEESKEDLSVFFLDILDKYYTFNKQVEENKQNKENSIKNLTFPYDTIRDGQKTLMNAVYYSLKQSNILYAMAPTGIGKTIATIYPAILSLNNPSQKIFYLTSKGMQTPQVFNTLKLLKDKGLKMKSIFLTAKQKMCINDTYDCDPKSCEFARNYYDKVSKAILDIFTNEDIFNKKTILEYAIKHNICPFEFSLDLSYYCDFIVCDYNYVFDPRVKLQRYFVDSNYYPKILVDEAHNLISRSRDMYSSTFSSNNLIELKNYLREKNNRISTYVKKCLDYIDKCVQAIDKGYIYTSKTVEEDFIDNLNKIQKIVDKCLAEDENYIYKNEVLENYFAIHDFTEKYKYFGNTHIFSVEKYSTEEIINIKCLDASKFILDTINKTCYGAVFFSATMYPIDYHMDLLTCGEGKYLELPSPFDPNNFSLYINDKISTKYKDRDNTLIDVVLSIKEMVTKNQGNYIAFLPSYKYLEQIKPFFEDVSFEVIIQNKNMTDIEKKEYLKLFNDTSKTKLGLFILGGSFSEGIDLIGDKLFGVIVVGLGLPQVNLYNNILKDYYEEKYNKGFLYAYTYPGFNKVVQAVGRVIRSSSDKGIALLVDNRYSENRYIKLFPKFWQNKYFIK